MNESERLPALKLAARALDRLEVDASGKLAWIALLYFAEGFPFGIVNDNLQLPRFAYMNDLLYFPVPEQGVVGGPFRLYFKTPELEEAVVVSFEIGKAMKP